jgi:hypothetical protein
VYFSQTTVNNNNKVRNRKAYLSAMLVLYGTEELHLRSAKIGPALGAVEHSGRTEHPNFEDIGDKGETISFDSLALKLINVFNKRFSPIPLFFAFSIQIN